MSKTDIKKEIENYNEGIAAASQGGANVIKLFVDALKPIIPDIEGNLGWAEAGIDTLCMYSRSHNVSFLTFPQIEKLHRLEEAIETVFPTLKYGNSHITLDTPFGVYLNDEEYKSAITALKALNGRD